MLYLIGTDEAGYGPNLGPLVISATVWRVDFPAAGASRTAALLAPHLCDLYELLAGVIVRSPAADDPSAALAIADSKALYKAGDGLRQLERGVLAMLALMGKPPRRWADAFRLLLDRDGLDELCRVPWHAEFDLPLPVDALWGDVLTAADTARRGLEAAGARFVAALSEAVFPERFNRLVSEHGSKGEVLSRLTLQLVARALELCPQAPAVVLCDKHGGRNRYGPLLQRQFPEPFIESHGESTAVSVYRWTDAGRRIEARFQARGESWLPAAAASMVSKYLRELAMRAFNDYWLFHLPDLRPTAGYPTDSRRFKRAIAERQVALGISDGVLWRER